MEWQGRTTPLTVFTIAPRWWTLWLRFMWGGYHLLRWLRRSRLMRRLQRNADPSPLAKLSSVSFAHWSLFNRIPADEPGRPPRRLGYSYYLFQSNYSGAHDQYIEAFALAIPWLMRALWAGAPGVPGPRPVLRFTRWIADNNRVPAHYYSAYPSGSTRMVTSALELRRRFDAFARRADDIDPDAFAEHYERFLGRVERSIAQPKPAGAAAKPALAGFCTFTRIEDGRQGALLEALKALPNGGASPLAGVDGTHFGRWVIVPFLRDRRGHTVSSGSYLLFSVEFDGPLDAYLGRLCDSMEPAAHRIWSHCSGYPGSVGEDFRRYLMDHRLDPGHSFAAYPEVTVESVRESLEVREGLLEFAAAHAEVQDGRELQRAWRERFAVATG